MQGNASLVKVTIADNEPYTGAPASVKGNAVIADYDLQQASGVTESSTMKVEVTISGVVYVANFTREPTTLT